MSFVSSEVFREVQIMFEKVFDGVISKNTSVQSLVKSLINPERASEQLQRLEAMLPVDPRGSKMLEIGSGCGMLLVVARQHFGIEAYGVEPGKQFYGAYECSLKLLAELGCPTDIMRNGVGEAIPYKDNSFDIVYSSNVLEHVQDPAKVIAEALRVLRPEGYLYLEVPNYGSWWEGHYGILWFPNLPKWLARLYVKLYGRDASFIDTLLLINRQMLENILDAHREHIEILGWGEDLWENRLRTLDFSEWACLKTLKRMAHWLHRLRLVNLVVWLGKRWHWETPFILIVRKR